LYQHYPISLLLPFQGRGQVRVKPMTESGQFVEYDVDP